MIEAVNSAVASSSVLRLQDGGINPAAQNAKYNGGKQVTAATSVPEVPYISPHIEVDVNYDKAVLQIRDSSTGDVLRQFPSESRLQELRRQAAAQQQRPVISDDDGDTGETTGTSDSGEIGVSSFDFSSVSDIEPTATPSDDGAALAQAQSAASALSGGGSTGANLSAGVSLFA